MSIHYYLSIFPLEALIASELDPEAFGVYMATGSRRGSSEQHVFIEVGGKLGDSFDLAYAEKKCAAKGLERNKSSVYLSIYRSLEAAWESFIWSPETGVHWSSSRSCWRGRRNRQNSSICTRRCRRSAR